MMVTKMQNRYNYSDYIKCGEILRPPCESTTRPYALKCYYCKEIYLLFEAFIFHIEDHCKNAIAEMEYDSNSTTSLSFDQHNNTERKENFISCDSVEEKSPVFMQIKVEPSAVIKSGSDTDSSDEDLLVETGSTSADNLQASKTSAPLPSEIQLIDSCNNKKLPRQEKALEKRLNKTTKTINVARNNIRTYFARNPNIRVIKTEDDDDCEISSVNKKSVTAGTSFKNCTSIAKKPSRIVVKTEDDDWEVANVKKKVITAGTGTRKYTTKKPIRRVIKTEDDDWEIANVKKKLTAVGNNVKKYTAIKPIKRVVKTADDDLKIDHVKGYIAKKAITSDVKTENDDNVDDKIKIVKTYLGRKPSKKILKTETNHDLELEICENEVQQQSNIDKNYEATDHNFESYPASIDEGSQNNNNSEENLLGAVDEYNKK